MPHATPAEPTILVVMGVSGSGKSTIGALLAERLGWDFVDGDDFHTPEHVRQMHEGHALDDADRAPWLARVRAWIDERLAAGMNGVIVCSALKRAYRDRLRGDRPAVRIVYLEGSHDLIARRRAARRGHFMAQSLLANQFATLEPPGPDEAPITVGIEAPPNEVVATIADRIARGASSRDA